MIGASLAEIVAQSGGQLLTQSPLEMGEVRLSGVSHDSRVARNGDLFACISGDQHDGHLFAAEALRAGALALLVERELDDAIPQVVVPNVRKALGPVAASIYGEPSKHLKVVGVTGTAGKTTTTQALAEVLKSCGESSSSMGTLDGQRTTPEAPELQRSFARLLKSGTDWVCMEVSSHGLELGRVDGTHFAAALFTNLSPEHLDFHGDMDAYFRAKRRLFDERTETAIVSVGDEWGRRLARELGTSREVVEVDPKLIQDPRVTANGATFMWRDQEIETTLVGYFNLLNLLMAAETLNALRFDRADIARGLRQVQPVRGRMEPVSVARSDVCVLVDYAHKPAALSEALKAARSITAGSVWVVLGAGGDRDQKKRSMMGEIAAGLADEVIVTSDNPRSEDPADIANQIIVGTQRGRARSQIILDRADAIHLAIGEAVAGDLILVAGKGHETHQTIGQERRPFDDVAVCEQALATRLEGRS
jgi:UDP-N-acetylmuramoyl-L-alanyl-D-glutamate--2,6-diaminopimelate ligase|tara:strand:+ start:635 stop:2068 length:1434 start_codon:yes stop_codon:yes gene_type:complete